MFRLVTIAGVAVATAPLACSPTFNWREVRVEATGLNALFPCKADHAKRGVDLAARSVSLQALACDAGAVTFAVLFADADPGSPAEFLDRRRAVVHAQALRTEFVDPFFPGLSFE